jgi:uncharacterized lipoprotein NlpE involved in copper resistance
MATEFVMDENYSEPVSPMHGYRAAAVIAVIALCVGLFGYSVHERSEVAKVSAQNQQVSAALSDTRSQIGDLTAKLNGLAAAEQARQQQITEARAAAAHRSSRAVVQRRRADDVRWKKVQSQLDAHQQAIDATRNDLTQAKTELSGSIARTHDELVVLQRKGERNYYEFDIDKTKQFHASGPVGIKLRKANTKHQYADLQLMVDDTQLDKKHVDLFEPVTFVDSDSGQPVQLVINRITKNHIHGYVAEPKYKGSELAASGNASGPANSADSASPVRKRLSIPNE